MHTYWITPQGLERFPAELLPELLKRDDGFVWVDVPSCDEGTQRVLQHVFGFHALAVKECFCPVPIPKIHVYPGHFFAVLHSVELVDGRLQTFQNNIFIHEKRFLVTVHGPHDSGTNLELATRETRSVLTRIEAGRLRPKNPGELGHAIIISLANRLEAVVGNVAEEVSRLERSVTRGRLKEYERMLERMFEVRHHLQTVRTIAGQSREVHARMINFSRAFGPESTLWLQDLLDAFNRLKAVCDGEHELLQEMLELYQTRVATDLSQLIRKLTALGAILVADTLVAGIYGMNFDVMPELHWQYGYPMALGMMAAVSAAMFWWFKQRDWF